MMIPGRELRSISSMRDLPSGYVKIANWKDPPCYQWVNPLCRLGHFQVRKLLIKLPEGAPKESGNRPKLLTYLTSGWWFGTWLL